MKNHFSNTSGSALVSLIIILPFLLLIVFHSLQLASSSFAVARRDQFRTHAQFSADAGVDFALREINQNESWSGTTSEIEIHNDGKVRTAFEVVVSSSSDDKKIITATGHSYSPVTKTEPSSSVKLAIDLRPITSGEFSVVTGVGGLYLSNSAKIVGGDVFVNGEISLTNSAQIGLSTNPVDVKVAHQNCPSPPDETYPRLCSSGENGEPISLNNNSRIYGSVSANNQISTEGMVSPGLIASSGVAEQPLPEHDRTAQIGAIAENQTGSEAGCGSGDVKTWPANLKITGDVQISNSCKLTAAGDVWITGELKMSNSSQLIVSDALGETQPTIMVDGQIAKFSNGSELKSNINDTGFQVINYWSKAACSPDCGDIVGQDLFDSRDETTIELSNSAEGPNTIFYSRWSRVTVSNSGQIGALVGQTVQLKNSGTITFGTSTGIGETF